MRIYSVDWCCIDDCPNRSVVVIESYPDDVGLCAEHRPIHGELEPWEVERRVTPDSTVDEVMHNMAIVHREALDG